MRDHCSGSGLTANWTNQPNASGLYLASDRSSCSPRPALCYRPLPAFSPSSCDAESDWARAPDAAPTGTFGSQHTCSTADPSQKFWSGRRCSPRQGSQLSLSLRVRVFHPNTRMHVRLLGPCYKKGRLKPLCQHPQCECGRNPAIAAHCCPQSQPPHTTKSYNTPKGATFPWPFSGSQN